MTEPISPTHHYLLARYGPLLTLQHLAEVMHSTPGGLRMAIARKRQPLTRALARTQRRVGRRVYFEARRVAEIIDRHGSGSGGNSSAGHCRSAIEKDTPTATTLPGDLRLPDPDSGAT